jgi:hypothetical protein
VVFQDFAQLFPWRTARRNVEFGLEMRRVPKAEHGAVALEFLSLVGLQNVRRARNVAMSKSVAPALLMRLLSTLGRRSKGERISGVITGYNASTS